MTTTTPPRATLTPERIARASQFIRHGAECVGGVPFEDRGAKGDVLIRCPGCHKFSFPGRFAGHPTPPKPTTTTTTTRAPVVLDPILSRTRYVCREHLRPTSWRGRGCQRCAEDHAARTAERGRRKARAEGRAFRF